MCMCGDTYCFSCGPAQGNSHCYQCGAWEADGGCLTPEKCKAERDGRPKPKNAKKSSKTPHLGMPLFNRKYLRAVYPIWRSKLHSPSFWEFAADLLLVPIFDGYQTNAEIAAELKKARVLRKKDQVTESHATSTFILEFRVYQEGLDFIQRLNQYLLDNEVVFPKGYRSQRQADYETFLRLKKQYGWI